MTDETMVERVARAISKLSYGMTGEPMVDWEDAEGMARAAIEAMREPTPEMLGATKAGLENASGWIGLEDLAAAYTAMIAAALKDGPHDAS